MKKERRQFKRVPSGKKVSTQSGVGLDESLLNVSDNGCCLKTQQVYKIGEEVLISINGGYKIGQILWNKGQKHGVKFKPPNRMTFEPRNTLKPHEKAQVAKLVQEGDSFKVLDYINNLLSLMLVL
jgi:hypothetical protein